VRHIGKRADRLGLRFLVPPELLRAPSNVRVTLDTALTQAFRAGQGKLDGLKADGKGGFLITEEKAEIVGLQMEPGQKGQVKVVVGPTKPSPRGPLDMTIVQVSRAGVDGGVTVRLATGK